MPNGTYGGVRGRLISPYSIITEMMKLNFIVINARKVLPWAALVLMIPMLCLWLGRSSAVYKVNGREIPIYSVERDDNKNSK